MTEALILTATAAAPLTLATAPGGPGTSLAAWVQLYGSLEAAAGAENTLTAKGRDLGLFMTFFAEKVGSDHADNWTRPVSEAFLKYLERDLGRKPTTINRVLASVRHCARWIHRQRPFLAGEPTAKIKELVVDDPEWKGVSPTDVLRLKSALEQMTETRKRKNQRPLRDRALVLTLLATGLRISELLRLERGQYEGRYFLDVKRKGKVRTRRVFISREAREAIDAYLAAERGDTAGTLFLSKNGGPMERQNVDRLLRLVAGQANAKLPEREHLALSAHKMRHTFLRRVTKEHGVEMAMELAGHTSANYIWRYVRPSEEEKEKALEALY